MSDDEMNVDEGPRGFDDFTLELGDVMRGERATMGKSLLDVQRELRIKASYIAAIENCDPSAFDTPGFIAGYVRSYARYLGMDPDECYRLFCEESGFAVAHGMSEKASTIRKGQGDLPAPMARDIFEQPRMPFVPAGESFFSRIEPGAIGSLLVLVALLGGIGYGGYAVLREVQRVQVAPVDQTPLVLSDLDPVQATSAPSEDGSEQVASADGAGPFSPPSNEALDRLYRPKALDVPVLVARDAPISSLDPSTVGAFAQAERNQLPQVDTASAAAEMQSAGLPAPLPAALQSQSVLDKHAVTLVAVRPAWVRVRDGGGNVLYERVMEPGDTWTVPEGQSEASLTVGESGALYLATNGQTLGPLGPKGQVTRDVALVPEVVTAAYQPADPQQDGDLQRVLAKLNEATVPAAAQSQLAQAAPSVTQPGAPKVLQDSAPGVTMIAVRPAWVRVRSADGSVIFEKTMRAGDTWTAPATQDPANVRVGESGAVYFAVNGQTYGPVGASGTVTKNLPLSVEHLTTAFRVADLSRDADLSRVVAELTGDMVRAD
ncbi:helix-turn-helix domain-containing protein [Alloyangia pacifica]|uniref:helix-turn-helix domain-containing protein n=1 Tax=Alloyangia pacifica TaxID=311180 RepID=UPI001CFC6625|nr:helix-turn-helix domain-containing protein [Alloyangia pacifica]